MLLSAAFQSVIADGIHDFLKISVCANVVFDREPHPSRTCKRSFLFAPWADLVQTGCSAFPFYTPTKPLIRLHINTKLFYFLNYIIFLYFRYL